MQKGAHAATRPVSALVGVTRGGFQDGAQRQQSALAGSDTKPATGPAAATVATAATSTAPPEGHADDVSRNGDGGAFAPAVAHRNESGKNERPAVAPNPHQGSSNARASVMPDSHQGSSNGHAAPVPLAVEARRSEPTPRAVHDDVMRRAGELRAQERSIGLGQDERRG